MVFIHAVQEKAGFAARWARLAVAAALAVCVLIPSTIFAVTIAVDGSVKQGAAPHFWENCVGRGGMIECLKPAWQNAARIGAQEAGFKAVRGHGMLMGWDNVDSIGMFHWTGNVSDTPTYTWTVIDSIITIITNCGMDPVMELDFMPKNLQSNGQTSKPKNWTMWQKFMANLAAHCINKFGKARVEKWYWEVWNEPDYSGFWNGSIADYDTMYMYAAAGIKSIDSALLVGGPAATGNGQDQAFLNFCINNKVPVDFLDNHQYGGSGGVTALPKNVSNDNQTRSTIIKNSGKALRSVNTEYNSCYCGAGGNTTGAGYAIDSHVNAPFVAKIVKNILDGAQSGYQLPDILSYWTISDCFDEYGGGNGGSYIESKGGTFTGGQPYGSVYGLITYQGIRKGAFNGFKLLHMMGSTRVSLTGGNTTNGVDGFATFNSDSSRATVMLYNFYDTLAKPVTNPVTLTVNNLPFAGGQQVTVTHYRVDSLHSNAYAVWLKLGKPTNPTSAQWDSMKAAQNLALMEPRATFTYTPGTPFTDTFTMNGQSLSLLIFSKAGDTNITRTAATNAPQHSSALSITGTVIKASGLHGSPLSVAIYGLNGKLLNKFSTMQNSIDIRNLSSNGVYVVSAQAMGERLTRKIVVRN